jgi:predicted MPP superfamily phosphohydrolase
MAEHFSHGPNPRRALMELDYYQRWLCPGRGRVAIENVRPLRVALQLLMRMPGVRTAAESSVLQVRRTSFTWRFDHLPPAFEKYRILHLSDLHIDAVDGLVDAVHRVTRETRPDLIVMTGDFRFETGGNFHLVMKYMEQLMSGLSCPDGIYGILGNHDAGGMIEPLQALGLRMLVNEHVLIDRGGDRIGLLGLDDCHYYGTDDLDSACRGLDGDLFKILLVHSPELYREAAAAGMAFYLCGHTHGGQIRLPLLGALLTNTACPRRYCDRSWRQETMQGYTHRGTGSSCVPLRFFCPPEATVHVLMPGGAA